MKFFTSYYTNFKNIPSNYMCIGISRFLPKEFSVLKYSNFVWYRNNFLAPSEDLLKRFKAGTATEDEYKQEFLSQVSEYIAIYGGIDKWVNDISKAYSDEYDAVVFVCYEKPGEFCHRHIVSKILQYYGYECQEFQAPKINTGKSNALF